MTIERAVRIIAGIFIMLSLALSHYHNPNWIWFTLFVGFNLFQSGITRFCPMDIFLKKAGLKSGGVCG